MKKILLLLTITGFLVSCKDKEAAQEFEISGTIINNPGSILYLEEIPVGTMQRIVVDSVKLDKDGKYNLGTGTREATIYNIRLDQNTYPIASVINDVKKLSLDVTFNPANNQFAESYQVKGSPVSQQLKDFMEAFNGKLQTAFLIDKEIDSLNGINAGDTMIARRENQRLRFADETKALFDSAISRSTNPALTMMILGYYQSTANNPGFKLKAIDNEEVTRIVNEVAAKFPDHQGVASVKQMLAAQVKTPAGLVGQSAPEITLPDVNGKQVSLSSFKGKYVLVDFWASWCKPCRADNPNLVKAFNKFKSKNFTILGVSLDQPGQKEEWLKAIKQDNLTWTQVSDLMFWNSPVVPLYGIDGIPFNVLVDPGGKIIAQGLHGPDLESKLAELLN